jgi:hypothetical protein
VKCKGTNLYRSFFIFFVASMSLYSQQNGPENCHTKKCCFLGHFQTTSSSLIVSEFVTNDYLNLYQLTAINEIIGASICICVCTVHTWREKLCVNLYFCPKSFLNTWKFPSSIKINCGLHYINIFNNNLKFYNLLWKKNHVLNVFFSLLQTFN